MMKKIFIVILVILIAKSCMSQEYTYCELLGTAKLFSTQVYVSIDLGERRKFFEDKRMKNEDGTPKTFNSMIDGLNYMGQDGWEFVQAYIVTIGNQNVYHYLLKKKNQIETK
jgi:hypothetical protein